MGKIVTLAVEGLVARVTLSRPEVHNSLSPQLVSELAEAISTAGDTESVRVVVLLAEGASFCAGADLGWMRSIGEATYGENLRDAMNLAEGFRAIHDCPKPVIARVQGPAYGGGVGLVAVCDVVVAVESAQFAFSEVRLGIVPALIAPHVLQKLNPGVTRRLFVTGERFGAAAAQQFGLVSAVVQAADLDAEVDRWVHMLLQNGPEAMASAKKLVDVAASLSLDAGLERMPEWIAERRASAEAREGLSAFLEKRKPRWVPEQT